MAVYKVPQDIEAEDKLLGPFTFRQFIYLIVVAMSGGLGYILWQLAPPLALISAPPIIVFGTLALPLKKDQPMETYVGAMVSFYFLKPRKRFWQPDGIESLVEITAPKNAPPDRVKHITQDEARDQLDYLSDIVESRGWSVRGVGVPLSGISDTTAMQQQQPATSEYDSDDMFSKGSASAQRFSQILDSSGGTARGKLLTQFQEQASAMPAAPPEPATTQNPTPSTSVNSVSTGIIDLANDNAGLSVSAMAKIANIQTDTKDHGLSDGDEGELSLH